AIREGEIAGRDADRPGVDVERHRLRGAVAQGPVRVAPDSAPRVEEPDAAEVLGGQLGDPRSKELLVLRNDAGEPAPRQAETLARCHARADSRSQTARRKRITRIPGAGRERSGWSGSGAPE